MKKEITIPVSKARTAYVESDEATREVLEKLFGKDVVSGGPEVKSLEDACRILKLEFDKVLPYKSDTLDRQERATNAFVSMNIIARALNGDHKFDWTNPNGYKYYPWFEYTSGVGFSCTRYAYWNASTSVGSRLCFKTAELAEYAGTQFQSLYNDLMDQ